MQIFRFSANFAGFVGKKVIFVNSLNPLRQFRGVWEGVGGAHYTVHIQVVYMKLIDKL